MIELGVQSPSGVHAAKIVEAIKTGIDGNYAPHHRESSSFIDAAGLKTQVFTLYWKGYEPYQQWIESRPNGWWHAAVPIGGNIGVFFERCKIRMMDTETSFSSRSPEGYARIADCMSGPTDSHEYFGSIRDRIPRAQAESLVADRLPSLEGKCPLDAQGHLLTVRAPRNLCIIRSGQVYEECDEEEEALYLSSTKPLLDHAMASLTNDGLDCGCLSNRYLCLENELGQPLKKTWSVSVWTSLDALMAWVKTEEHRRIFAAGMKHFRQSEMRGKTSGLKLWHEVAVLDEDQFFQYFNCHKKTGLLSTIF